ncbi:helix-turn-helix transcriptional regulator [Paenibacillus sp. MMS18-CY102]|uniref:helix-turn-helix transcriptional regulator n=1 Tax=Paenibacillus sp. MMS18-CY102 TaxID=2682849 RepID=UPI001365809E|nr:AraC family transcriptional regulator [Paenibacillus sp. MMS18-CY102]MWC29515.1 helix-turn-helix domain-containing protein [Paenibacillus sp. MMS18-CY102]
MLNGLDFTYRNTGHYEGAQFHSHPFYELYFFHGGQCTYIVGDRLWTLAPGDILLLHGMTLHCPNPSPEVPYVRSIIHFEPSVLQRQLPNDTAKLLEPFERFGNARLSLDGAERADAEKLLSDMHAVQQGGSPFAAQRTALRFAELLYAINEWFDKPQRRQLEPASERERHVQRAITFVEEHFTAAMTLKQIADALHLTKPYLSQLFKDVTGTTIFKYVYNRRINQAKLLLQLDASRPVSEVAHAAGFVHPAHFSRMFKETVGCTAEAFRARMRGIPPTGTLHE